MALDLFSIGRFTVHGYGLMIGLGFVIGMFIACMRAQKLGLSSDHLTNIAIYVLVIGFIGGKLLYVIVNFNQFLDNPLSVLGSGGFVVYGGIITGILSIYVYCRIKKLSFLSYMDMLCPAVAVNQGFGRIGCFLAGCCYGKETDSCLGVVFPKGCLAPAGIKLLPTQLFSSAFDFAVAIFIFCSMTKYKNRGTASGIYLLLYGVGRFIIEFFRGDDERGSVGVLSTSQFISLFMVAFAVGYILYSKKAAIPTEYATQATDVSE